LCGFEDEGKDFLKEGRRGLAFHKEGLKEGGKEGGREGGREGGLV